LKAYQFATHKGERGVVAASSVRLGLALHYGIFMWDVVGQKADAMTLIKKAVSVAEPKLDQITDEDGKLDSTTSFELCKQQITEWEEEIQKKKLEDALKVDSDDEE